MAKPIIGVTTSSHGFVIWRCIQLGVWMSGGKAVRITANAPANPEQFSGFLIAGGADISPSIYGQENTASINIDDARDALEKNIITYALEHQKPLFGICRGAQMINVIKGGTLHQEARDIYEEFLPTTSLIAKIFKRRPVKVHQQSHAYELFDKRKNISVNSIHHQAIDALGSGLKISAEGEHTITQAIESTDNNLILGVQWHPEFMLYSKFQRNFFKQLVKLSLKK